MASRLRNRRLSSNFSLTKFEELEARRMLAIFTVGNTTDVVDMDQDCANPTNTTCSLREAIAQANSEPNADTIQFAQALFNDGPKTIEVDDAPTHGAYDIDAILASDADLTIIGPGTELLTIDGQRSTRIFDIGSLGSVVKVGLSMMTLRGGFAPLGSGLNGGAIRSYGEVVLDEMVVVESGAVVDGEAIYQFDGSLTISDTTIRDSDLGAAIFITGSASLQIDQSTMSGNSTALSITTTDSAVISNSTFSGNSGDTTIDIFNADGGFTARHITVADNESVVAIDAHATGATIHNSIVAGNSMGDVAGIFDPKSSYNLIGIDSPGSGLSEAQNNIIGTTSQPEPSGLTPLGDFGGMTQTHGLLAGSKSIDSGSNAPAHTLPIDQRGTSRPVDVPNEGIDGTDVVDRGAIEATMVEVLPPTLLSLDTDSDTLELIVEFELPHSFSSAQISLIDDDAREVGVFPITDLSPGQQTISFHPELNGNWMPEDSPYLNARIDGLAAMSQLHSSELQLGRGVFQEANDGPIFVSGTDDNDTIEITRPQISVGNRAWLTDLQNSDEVFVVPQEGSDLVKFTDDTIASHFWLVEHAGTDKLDFSGLNKGISIDLADSNEQILFPAFPQPPRVSVRGGWEDVDGTPYNDTILGNGTRNRLFGGFGGIDYLDGRAADDGYRLTNTVSTHTTINDTSGEDDAIRIDRFWDRDIGGEIHLGIHETQTVFDHDGVVVELLLLEPSAGMNNPDRFIERLIGSDYDDQLFGNSADNFIRGGNGNDRIFGGGGNDVLRGEYGRDLIWGESGDDVVDGGFGSFDIVSGGSGFDFEEIVDNSDMEFNNTGGTNNGFGFNGSQIVFEGSPSSGLAEWSFEGLDPNKQYNVYASWSPESVANPSTAARFSLVTSSRYTVEVDQSQEPDDRDENGVRLGETQDRPWQLLRTVRGSGGSLTVTLDDLAGGNEIADAIKIEPVKTIGSQTPPTLSYSDPNDNGVFGDGIKWTQVSGSMVEYEVQVSLNGVDRWVTFRRTSELEIGLTTGQVQNGHFYRVRGVFQDDVVTAWSNVLDRRVVGNSSKDHVLQLTVNIPKSVETGKPTISWPLLHGNDGDPHSADRSDMITIYRRNASTDEWVLVADDVLESLLDTYEGHHVIWSDNLMGLGDVLEYRVERQFTYLDQMMNEEMTATARGYIEFGLEADLTVAMSDRGSVVLVVDDSIAGPLDVELQRLERDLEGDGWNVIRLDVDVNVQNAARIIKNQIHDEYAVASQNVKSVILFGEIPVIQQHRDTDPPDGHNDKGGRDFETDMFYGDMWDPSVDPWWPCDSTCDDTNQTTDLVTAPLVDINGVDDADGIPIELSVGRIDMSGMEAFDRSEIELLRDYLDKNHAYRQGNFELRRRGILFDNFGAQGAYSSFSAMFGPDNLDRRNWFATLTDADENYLWGMLSGAAATDQFNGLDDAEGGGSIGTTDFAQRPSHSVFNFIFGSYILEWNERNNLMRAMLANEGYGLTATWGAQPQKFYHHMALGETVGFGNQLSQNNDASDSGVLIEWGLYRVPTGCIDQSNGRPDTSSPCCAIRIQRNIDAIVEIQFRRPYTLGPIPS